MIQSRKTLSVVCCILILINILGCTRFVEFLNKGQNTNQQVGMTREEWNAHYDPERASSFPKPDIEVTGRAEVFGDSSKSGVLAKANIKGDFEPGFEFGLKFRYELTLNADSFGYAKGGIDLPGIHAGSRPHVDIVDAVVDLKPNKQTTLFAGIMGASEKEFYDPTRSGGADALDPWNPRNLGRFGAGFEREIKKWDSRLKVAVLLQKDSRIPTSSDLPLFPAELEGVTVNLPNYVASPVLYGEWEGDAGPLTYGLNVELGMSPFQGLRNLSLTPESIEIDAYRYGQKRYGGFLEFPGPLGTTLYTGASYFQNSGDQDDYVKLLVEITKIKSTKRVEITGTVAISPLIIIDEGDNEFPDYDISRIISNAFLWRFEASTRNSVLGLEGVKKFDGEGTMLKVYLDLFPFQNGPLKSLAFAPAYQKFWGDGWYSDKFSRFIFGLGIDF